MATNLQAFLGAVCGRPLPSTCTARRADTGARCACHDVRPPGALNVGPGARCWGWGRVGEGEGAREGAGAGTGARLGAGTGAGLGAGAGVAAGVRAGGQGQALPWPAQVRSVHAALTPRLRRPAPCACSTPTLPHALARPRPYPVPWLHPWLDPTACLSTRSSPRATRPVRFAAR